MITEYILIQVLEQPFSWFIERDLNTNNNSQARWAMKARLMGC